MKKFLGLIMIFGLMFSVCACKNSKNDEVMPNISQTAQISEENENTADVINNARAVASYFYFDNHDANYYDEAVSVSQENPNKQWCKVTDTRFNTLDNAKKFLKTQFSNDLADKILNYAMENEFFKEIDGNLYALIGDGGRIVDSVEYAVDEKTDSKISYSVVVKYFKDEDENGEPIYETKEYNFVREKINGEWIFTNFEYVW